MYLIRLLQHGVNQEAQAISGSTGLANASRVSLTLDVTCK
jgi:hypothetical protein